MPALEGAFDVPILLDGARKDAAGPPSAYDEPLNPVIAERAGVAVEHTPSLRQRGPKRMRP